jgi:hypothetical protein
MKNNNPTITEIEQSIERTLEISDLANIDIDLAEVTIDSIMNDGLLKDLPIVSSIVGLTKLGIKTRDFLLLKKILKFLTQLDSTTNDERQKFIRDVETNETYNKKVGLALILILDKLEDLEKPEILGKLLTASIKGIIDYQTFLRLSYLIQKLFIPDLEYLRKIRKGIDVDYNKQDELYLSGLMISIPTGGARFDGRNEYLINPLAETLLEIID